MPGLSPLVAPNPAGTALANPDAIDAAADIR